MAAKLIFVVGLLVVSLVAVLGAPKPLKEEDLQKSVIEFLKQDKQFITEFEKMKLLGNGEGLPLRNRRQTEMDDNIPDSAEDEKPGFFDRAAKFIVDLLQRFLKWVNTDSN
ncbi:uncharacterized protein LOC108916155 [Anoplophora glabripennis]|uniref:uncharacterized protein LOC108916155 n=1 Tax=Anoplophora glabripennis TaxID=217634 RepID=UPI0008743E84|nr:uncharacterized protein LOC108916155 [Anoplophora glabripennis]